MAVYRMYVDESGDPVYRGSANVGDRYLGVTGVVVDREYHETKIRPDLESLKRRHFEYDADDPPILHRKDIIGKREAFSVLEDDSKKAAFDADWLVFLRDHRYRLVSVVIDKKNHLDRYGEKAWEPYGYCFRVLLQRYMMLLGRHNQGDVMAEARGTAEDRNLGVAYYDFWSGNDNFIAGEEAQRKLTSCKLKVKPKVANIAGLQMADLLVTDIKRDIILEKTGQGVVGPYARLMLKEVESRHDTTSTGGVWGAGKVWIYK